MRYFCSYQEWYEKSFNRYINSENGNHCKLNLIKSPWFAICFIILLSISLGLLHDSWMYTHLGWLDPWMYVGYGYTFDDRKFGGAFKGGYYKLSRVFWISLQYLVRRFFSPLTATYILQYFCLWLGTFSAYFTIRRLLGYVPALMTALFLCVYQPFLGSGGADYHNTLVGPLYALSFLILTIAAQSEKQALKWLILFGCVYFMVAHTLILYVNFAPIMLIHFYAVRKVFCKEQIHFIKFISATLFGGILATAIGGLISRAFGYPFFFFLPQFGLTKTFLYGSWSVSPWWKPWGEWVLNANWIGPLVGMLVFALGLLSFRRKERQYHLETVVSQNLLLQFVFLGAIWLFWQLLKKDMLNTPYFAYPLIIPFAISIGASFSLTLSNSVRNRSLYLPIIFGITALIALSLRNQLSLQFFFQIPPLLLLFLLFIAVLTLLSFKQHICAVILLAFSSTLPFYYQNKDYSFRDGYLAVTEATRWLYNTYGQRDIPNRAKNIFIWFDEKTPKNPCCPISDIGYSLTNTTFDFLQPAFPMPSIQDLNLQEIQAKLSHRKTKIIVLITENENHVKDLQNRLEQVGLYLTLVQIHEIRMNSIKIPLYVLKG